MVPPGNIPTLEALGLTKKESQRAQFIAKLPKETFEAIKKGEHKR